MAKLPSVIALAAITALLAGCAGTSSDEPEAASVSAAPTASASAQASPSVTPSPVVTTTPSSTPEPVPTQEEAAPEETPADVVTPVEPPAPETAVEAPAEAPLAIATAETWDGAPRVTVAHGSSFTVTSTGYQPGQNVLMLMGIYQTDSTEVDEQSAGADATGSVSFTIAVTPDIEPKTYGVVSMILDGQIPGEDREASKRFALVDVTAG